MLEVVPSADTLDIASVGLSSTFSGFGGASTFAAGALPTVAKVAAVATANCITPRRGSGLHPIVSLHTSRMSISCATSIGPIARRNYNLFEAGYAVSAPPFRRWHHGDMWLRPAMSASRTWSAASSLLREQADAERHSDVLPTADPSLPRTAS
jgi:hypothetical protein